MQKYEEKSITAKTFPELWVSLTATGRSDLRDDIKRRVHCTSMSVSYWSRGLRNPKYLVRKEITDACSKLIGIKLNINVLFPPIC